MRPVLEQLAGGDGVGDQRAGVGAEPGEQGQFLAAHGDVDRVDLDQADVVEDAAQVLAGHPSTRPRAREPWAARAMRRAASVDRRVTIAHRSTGMRRV